MGCGIGRRRDVLSANDYFWHAYGAAAQANAKKLEVKDWKRVLEMIETMDPNYTFSAVGCDPSDQDAGC